VRAVHCSALPTDPKLAKGLFVRPVLLVDVPHDSPICTNEIFGPVAAIMRWKDFDEVLHRANDTNFGLSASVWTNDLKMALQAVKQLEAGIVQGKFIHFEKVRVDLDLMAFFQ
jgi:aldehyde dehydrogenase (NAD+)